MGLWSMEYGGRAKKVIELTEKHHQGPRVRGSNQSVHGPTNSAQHTESGVHEIKITIGHGPQATGDTPLMHVRGIQSMQIHA